MKKLIIATLTIAAAVYILLYVTSAGFVIHVGG